MRRLLSAVSCALIGLVLAGCQTTGDFQPASQPTTTSEAAKLNTQLGVEYMRTGKYELAYKRLKRAVAADPRYSTAHNALGLVYARFERPDDAERHFRKAISLNPADSSAQNNFGLFLCKSARFEEGEQRFLDAVKNSLYERPENAYANAGICMKGAGKLDKAESYFRRTLTIDNTFPVALLQMADLSLQKDRALQARGYLQRFLDASPASASALWLGVRIERELGDETAQTQYAQALQSDFPDSTEVQMLLESSAQ